MKKWAITSDSTQYHSSTNFITLLRYVKTDQTHGVMTSRQTTAKLTQEDMDSLKKNKKNNNNNKQTQTANWFCLCAFLTKLPANRAIFWQLILTLLSHFLQDDAFSIVKEKAIVAMADVNDAYKPQRRYKRHDASSIPDEETRVHSTLLEYGRYVMMLKLD